jgi:hypothetical protein
LVSELDSKNQVIFFIFFFLVLASFGFVVFDLVLTFSLIKVLKAYDIFQASNDGRVKYWLANGTTLKKKKKKKTHIIGSRTHN